MMKSDVSSYAMNFDEMTDIDSIRMTSKEIEILCAQIVEELEAFSGMTPSWAIAIRRS